MTVLSLILPFALLSFIIKAPFKEKALKLGSHIFMLSIFTVLPVLPFYFLVFTFDLYATLFVRVFNNEAPLLTPRFLVDKWQLKDSIKQEISLPLLCFSLSIIFASSFFLPKAPVFFLLFFPATLFTKKNHLPYFLLCIKKLCTRKKTYEEASFPRPENECFIYLNKEYPLEKQTLGFSGKKTFSLTKEEKPHVVFVYLESFRSHEVDENTPTMNFIKHNGIYFSNFYANASQTFKAMFATMYGLIPSFGSDIEKSSSPVLTLPTIGIADLLKKAGYQNVFIKAGNNYFDRQGDFLKNHCFDETYDENDIKNSLPDAFGTSWGVHDEFFFSYFFKKIQQSSSPLYISGATITSHHPFILPKSYTYTKTGSIYRDSIEYTDRCLGKFVENLKTLQRPVHLYVMGDHGFAKNSDNAPHLSPSLDPFVTKVPFAILPINCGSFTPTVIDAISSQIDVFPTIMDLYDLKSINSSMGSSLCRERVNPKAYLLNEFMDKISGEVTKDSYTIKEGYNPLCHAMFDLYTKEKISSSTQELKTLDLSDQNISSNNLKSLLETHPQIQDLILNNCKMIASLDLPFSTDLKKLSIEHNIFIENEDLLYIPNGVQSISLLGCNNLTNKSLSVLAKMSLKEVSLSCKNFSHKQLANFIQSSNLQKIHLTQLQHIDPRFYECFHGKHIEELILEGSTQLEDSHMASIATNPLKVFMSDSCQNIKDNSLKHFSNTRLKVLHLENANNITSLGITHLKNVPIHTFYISKAHDLCEKSLKILDTKWMQNVFCIDCKNLENTIFESGKKKVYCLKKDGLL